MRTRRTWPVSDETDASPYERWQVIGGLLIAVAIVAKLIAFALMFRFKIGFVGPQGVVLMLLAAFTVAALGLGIGLTATYLDWRRRHRP